MKKIMIPKKIHYCWFGRGDKTKLAQKCIASWKRHCPEYEIIEWNEDNFDVNQHPYLRWCYENKKWAFLSDFARLLVVKEFGGLYFDTDVELLRKPEELLQYAAFYGFENEQIINTGEGFGAEPGHPTLIAMIQQYLNLEPNSEGSYSLITCPKLNTEALLSFGLRLNGEKQILSDTIVLPYDFLNPYDDETGRLNKTENTISIHWYSKSWLDKKVIFRSKITKLLHRVFGKDCLTWLKKK